MSLTPTQRENCRRWAEKLETSKKAKGQLVRGARRCCLGVACEVLGKTQEEMEGVDMPCTIDVSMLGEFGVRDDSELAVTNDGDGALELTHREIALLVWLHIESDGEVLGTRKHSTTSWRCSTTRGSDDD